MVNTRAQIKKIKAFSGALIGSNDDILTEILLRVPVTSILRFKSVSKHWQWLLSVKSFTLRYHKILKSPGIFVRNVYVPFDVENQSTPPFRTLDFHSDPHGITIEQSCNGLLLCRSDTDERADRKYYVFNPTTKQYAIIPSVRGGRDGRDKIRFMGMVFHETRCMHYKLVCFLKRPNYDEVYQIRIFSSETRKWKVSIKSFSMKLSLFPPFSKVYWDGTFHWDPFCQNPSYFNVETEQLQKLPVTPQMESLQNSFYGLRPLFLGESRGHLHLVHCDRLSTLHLNVYEMLSDHSGWFVKFKVELDELYCAFPEMSCGFRHSFSVCDVVRGEREEDTFMVLEIVSEKIIKYNVYDKSFEHIYSFTNKDYIRPSSVYRYIESLASL